MGDPEAPSAPVPHVQRWSELAQQFFTEEDDTAHATNVEEPLAPAAPVHAEVPRPLPATLPSSAVEHLGRPLAQVLGKVDVFQAPFQQVVEELANRPSNRSEDSTMHRLADFFLEQPNKLHMSKRAIGEHLQLDPSRIEDDLTVLLATLFHQDRISRHLLEEQITRSERQCLFYLDLNKYDETPMKVSLKQQFLPGVSGSSSTPPPLPRGDITQMTGPSRSPHAPAPFEMKLSAKSKLFACDNRFAMLLKVPPHLQQACRGPYLALMGSTLSPLHVLEKTSGALTKVALDACNGRSTSSARFTLKARVSTSDAAGSNDKAERQIACELGEAWSCIHLHCNVHKIAGLHNHSFAQVQRHVTGVINFSLALSDGSSMAAFRRSLAEIVRSKLTIKRGFPSAAAIKYREEMLRLFCSTGRQRSIKSFLLGNLPNGDWRDRDSIEIWVAPGVDFVEEELAEQVTQGLLPQQKDLLHLQSQQVAWLRRGLGRDRPPRGRTRPGHQHLPSHAASQGEDKTRGSSGSSSGGGAFGSWACNSG